jgi:hypothetical protein
VPIPGAFHIGLNAQEGVFLNYLPVISSIWKAVFPKKKLPPQPSPLERKYALELACEVWKKCRGYCLHLLANVDKAPYEAIFLTQFFEEYLPISLDIYAIFLSGNFHLYEASLLRMLRMFIQFGKCNYVLCMSIFIAQLLHWKTHFPALHAQLQEKLRYLSEEEIEILNGMVRGHVRWKKTSAQVVRAINAWGTSMKMLRSWRPRKLRKHSIRARAVQLTAERVHTASKAVKALFAQVVTMAPQCTWDAAEGKWQSPALGTFADHALPYALQRARVRVRGCSAIANDDRVQADGYLDPKQRRLCGHEKCRGAFCRACMESTLTVVREMMDQSVLCGAIRMDLAPANNPEVSLGSHENAEDE